MKVDDEFYAEIGKLYPGGLEWGLVGILTKHSKVHTLSYDSKILSGIFEIFCEPIVFSLAEKHGTKLEKSAQTAYPDFTLFEDSKPKEKIAIEVKSTYRKFHKNGSVKKFRFTLGSYRSFLRDPEGKKGILYPYSDYIEHWVIGFLYTRNPECKITEIRQIIEASQLQSPFTDIEFFVQKKFRIAGRTPGSGNTTNIGSISCNNIHDFKEGKLGFSSKSEFDQYWREYKK
ncbi:MAG: type II restriction endonuclease [bacterium]